MLVLSRKIGQDIVIQTPDGIEIVVRTIQIYGGKVRLGIEAPQNVKVHCREVVETIAREGAREEGGIRLGSGGRKTQRMRRIELPRGFS